MPSGPGERYDFFLSRRGSVAAIAQEVTDVLTEKGYKLRHQDYDFQLGTSFVEEMHEAVKNSRDLLILFTRDRYREGRCHSSSSHGEHDRNRAGRLLQGDDRPKAAQVP